LLNLNELEGKNHLPIFESVEHLWVDRPSHYLDILSFDFKVSTV